MSIQTPESAPQAEPIEYSQLAIINGVQRTQEQMSKPPGRFNRMGWKGKLGCVALASAAVIGVGNTVADHIGLPHLPGLHDILPDINIGGSEPSHSKVASAMVPEAYETESTFDLGCESQVTTAVRLEAHKPQNWLGVTWGHGNLNKVIFGDVLLCGDNGSVSGRAVLTHDPKTNKVTHVRIETDGLVPTHARVDHEDPRNCAKGRYGDSKAELDKKIKEYNTKVLQGKKPECDQGFDGSGATGYSVASVKDAANTAAQITMELDANPQVQVDSQNPVYLEKLRSLATQKYPDAIIELALSSAMARRQDRLQAELVALQNQGYHMEKRPQENHPDRSDTIVITPSGDEIKVQSTTLDVKPFLAGDIHWSAEQVMPKLTPTTTVLPGNTPVSQGGR